MIKGVVLLSVLVLMVFGMGSNLLAYEGGTKIIATMTHSEQGQTKFSPVILIPHDELTPGKPFLEFLRRVPEPTLSMERIREERPGRSLGTKTLIRFQREGNV